MPVPNATGNSSFARRAVVRLSSIELWERYSFYNAFTLLPLFLVAPVAARGMGWSSGDALRFFGVYLLIVSTAPLAGGYIIDRWLREETALKLGALGLLIGHGLLAIPSLMPQWLVASGGETLAHALHSRSIPLGSWALPDALSPSLWASYRGITLCFYGAILLIAVGSALFKPILTVAVGRLPHASPAARNGAFTTFFVCNNAGGLLASLLGGALAQRYGWGWAFVGAAIGMLVARLLMSLFESTYILPFLSVSRRERTAASEPVQEDLSFGRPVGLLLLMLIVFTVFAWQSYGFVSLFVATLVDRSVAGFTIPPSWFASLNPITIIVLSPLLTRLWRIADRGPFGATSVKFAGAFMLLLVAFASLVAATLQAAAHGRASPWWVLAAILIIATSELVTQPAGMAAMTRLPPPNRQSLAVGAWAAGQGVGGWLSGKVGALAMETNNSVVLATIAASSLACAVLLMVARTRLARLSI